MDCSLPGSSVRGILQEESPLPYWSGLLIPFPGGLPDPGIELGSLISPALAGGFFTDGATREALKSDAEKSEDEALPASCSLSSSPL